MARCALTKRILSGGWPYCVLALLCAFLHACNVRSPYPHADLAPLSEQPSFAVLTTNYVSTAIALLNTEGELITEAWVDSGTTPPGITTTLGGDVVLPSTSPSDGTLTLIDRLGVDVITRISVPSGEVLQQVHAQSNGTAETGFRANPQDWLVIDADSAWVSRHEPNRNPRATGLDRGNDVLFIDLKSGLAAGRADFVSLEQSVQGTAIFARPTQLQRLQDTIAVGMSRLSLDFRTAATGALGFVDVNTLGQTFLEFPGLVNCGMVAKVPNSDTELWVLCAGDTFGGAEERRLRSGLVRVSAERPGIARETYRMRATDHGNLLPPSTGLIPLDTERVIVIASGDASHEQEDQVLLIDTGNNTVTTVFEATESFVLGQGCYLEAARVLLIPDASAGARRWVVTSGHSLEPLPTIDVSPLRRLPAREIRAIQTREES